jgi:diacylglycerol kinase (ATP)
MRVTLMHNPKAGHDGPDDDDLIGMLRDAGHKVEYQSTKKKRWKDALDEKADLVVVAGGDGTVGRVAVEMAGRGVPLAVLPCGTANNIATSLGIRGSIEEIVAGWDEGRRRKFDIGVASGPWGEHRFIEAVGFGLFTNSVALVETTEEVEEPDSRDEELHRDLNFLRMSLDTTRSHHRHIVLDGEDLSGDYFLVEIMNISCLGPNLCLAPHASPGDGRLDVVLLGEDERALFERFLDRMRSGEAPGEELPVRSGRRLEVRWDGAPLHVDSDIYADAALPDRSEGAVIGVWLEGEVDLLVGRA